MCLIVSFVSLDSIMVTGHGEEAEKDLGDHYTENPLEEPPKKKLKQGGNPEAFAEWIRVMVKDHGKHKVRT